MENTQNTQNTQTPQTPQQNAIQAQAQFLNDVITKAALDANNPQHQKMAVEVLQNIQALQAPEREKERNALMREFGIQPDEFKQALAGFNGKLDAAQKQVDNIDQQLKAFGEKGQELNDKMKKKSMLSSLIGLAVGIGAAIGIYKGWLGKEEKDIKGWKKWTGTILTGLVGSRLGSTIARILTTKPILKEGEQLQADIENYSVQRNSIAKNSDAVAIEAKQYQYNVAVQLASRMLKTRVESLEKAPEKVTEKAESPVQETPALVAPKTVPEEKTFTDKVKDKDRSAASKVLETVGLKKADGEAQSKASKVLETVGLKAHQDKILEEGTAPKTNTEKIEAQKEAAAVTQNQVG